MIQPENQHGTHGHKCRTVVLLHLPGSANFEVGEHYDWLIEVGAEAPLVAFRTKKRPDCADMGNRGCVFEAERLTDHRSEYLTYQGPVSGDRGHVTRVREGSVCMIEMSDTDCAMEVVFEGVRVRYAGVRFDLESRAQMWRFTASMLPSCR